MTEMKRIAHFITRNSKKIIVITLILNMAAAISLIRAKIDVSVQAFFNIDDRYTEELKRITEKYGGTDTIEIVVTSEEDLTTKKNLLELWRYYTKILAIDGVASVITFIPPVIPGSYPPLKTSEKVLKKYHAKISKMIEEDVGKDRGFSALFISKDRKSGIIQVRLKAKEGRNKYETLWKIKAVEKPDDMNVRYTGSVVIYDTLLHTLLKILLVLPPSVFSVLFIVFYLNVRNRRCTLFALLPAALSALWVFGTIFWSGLALNLILVITPIFVMIMGSADGLHFVIHFLENYFQLSHASGRENNNTSKIIEIEDNNTGDARLKEAAIAKTLEQVGIPMIITSVTTMVGFLSLSFSRIAALRNLGLFAAVGISYAGIISWFFLPALLSHITIPEGKRKKKLGEQVLKLLDRLNRKPIIPICFFSLVVLLSIMAIPRLTVYSDQLLFFKKHSAIRKDFAFVEKKFGSSEPLIGEVKIKGKLSDRGRMEEIYKLERKLEGMEGIYRVYSIVDILKWNYEKQVKKEGFPPPMLVRLMLKLFPETRRMISKNGVLLFMITRDWNTERADKLLEFVKHEKDLTITGIPILFTRLNELVVETQKSSLLITSIGIFLILLFLYRNLKNALVSMIPIYITVTGIYGLLYITGFNLNILTVTMSSIAIGVGIDYAIHFVFLLDYFKERDSKTFIRDAMHSSGIPILANALGITFGMLVLFLSPLRVHFQVAVVMIFAMLVSSISTLTIIPLFFKNVKKT